MASQEGESDTRNNHTKDDDAVKTTTETGRHSLPTCKGAPDIEIIYERVTVKPGTDAVTVRLETPVAESQEQKSIDGSSKVVRPKYPSAWWVNGIENEPGSNDTEVGAVTANASREDSGNKFGEALAFLEDAVGQAYVRLIDIPPDSDDLFEHTFNGHMKPLLREILARWKKLRSKLLDIDIEAAMDADNAWSAFLVSLVTDKEFLEQTYDSVCIIISGIVTLLAGAYYCRWCDDVACGVYYICKTCPPPDNVVCKFCHDCGIMDNQHTHEMEIIQIAICDNCDQHNPRVYYMCQTCPEHNLCDKCYGRNTDNEHDMELTVSERDSPQCFGCLEVTAGYYFKCQSCSYFVLCQTCNDNGVEHTHKWDSSFPMCDGCKERVIAIHHSCRRCPDYGLCGACHEQGIHNEHTMDLVIPDEHRVAAREIFKCFITDEQKEKYPTSDNTEHSIFHANYA